MKNLLEFLKFFASVVLLTGLFGIIRHFVVPQLPDSVVVLAAAVVAWWIPRLIWK